jgi:hypothetical protein
VITEDELEMKTKKKIIVRLVGVAAALTMGLGMGIAPLAEAQPAGGGDWTYGTTWNTGWSSYYHGSKRHSATECVYDVQCTRATANAGWRVTVTKGGYWGRKAYWSTY